MFTTVLHDLNREGATPIYQQLMVWMRQQITAGAWPPGHKLTAEADLAAELDIARGTVRRAIEELIAEGLLTRTHGRGTFVTPRPVDQPLADRLVTYSESLMAQGIAYQTRVLEQSVIAASPAIAKELGVTAGTRLFYLKRVRVVEGVPLILLHNYVVCSHCPAIEKTDFVDLRLFQVLEEQYGLRLNGGTRTFQAMLASEYAAQHLEIAPGDAVMHIAQTTYLPGGEAVEFSDVWLRGNRFRLTAMLNRSDKRALDILYVVDRVTEKRSAGAGL